MSGWISIHRKLQEHWIWQEKPFDKRSAWIDLILSANYKDNKFLLGNELVEVERGSFITSELKLMKKWGWSKTKVRNFLKLLEEDGMLIKKSDTKKTTLTIVNYNDYQDIGTTERPQEDHEETTEELRKNTNNKENKENKDNNSLCMYDEDLKKVVNLFEQNIGVIPPILINEIHDYTKDFKEDMFSEAIKIASNKKNRTVKYVLGILRNWKDANILTISDLESLRKEKEIERDKKKQTNISYTKPKPHKTRFHNFEGRSDKYSNDELEDKMEKKRQQARERIKDIGHNIGIDIGGSLNGDATK